VIPLSIEGRETRTLILDNGLCRIALDFEKGV
jgi:hypothetical protein